MIKDTRYIGDIPDERDETALARDYRPQELYDFGAVKWRRKQAPPGYQYTLGGKYRRRFPVRDQDGSNTCVAQTHAKLLGIEEFNETGTFKEFSARPIYRWRNNRPWAGMSSIDAFGIGSKKGTTTEERLPSQRLDDSVMDAQALPWDATDAQIAYRHRGGGYVTIFNAYAGDTFSIDELAGAMEATKAGLAIHIFATFREYNRFAPTIYEPGLLYEKSTVRHCVTGVDYTLHNKEKAIVIDESWGNDSGSGGQRVLTESFLRERLRYAGHYLPLVNSELVGTKPSAAAITKQLRWNDSGPAVVALQDILKFEGKFPSNVKSTGLFWTVTANAVKAWQLAHGFTDFAGTTDPRIIQFGPKSVALARTLYP